MRRARKAVISMADDYHRWGCNRYISEGREIFVTLYNGAFIIKYSIRSKKLDMGRFQAVVGAMQLLKNPIDQCLFADGSGIESMKSVRIEPEGAGMTAGEVDGEKASYSGV